MRYLLSLLILTGCASVSSYPEGPVLSSLHIIDRNGMTETISTKERLDKYKNTDFLLSQPYEKVLRIYERDYNGNICATVTSYHQNGQVKQCLEVVNNRAFGTFKEWHANGNPKVEAHVIGGEPDITTSAEKSWLFDGICKAWDENGILQAEIAYEKGELHGDSLYYHQNGHLWKRVPYCRNQQEGVSLVFLDDGQLLIQTAYSKGNKHGPSLRYWNQNQVSSQENYTEGKLMTACYFDQEGKEIARIDQGNGYRATFDKEGIAELHQYQQGILEGEVQVFSSLSQLTSRYRIRNGLKHGEEIQYYLNGSVGISPTPKLSVNWYEGIIQGIVKTWYENGVLESQREFTKNQKNGLLTAWYRDGSLMMIEEYDNGHLIKGSYFKKGEKNPISQILDQKGIATLYDSEGNFLRKIAYFQGKPADI